MKELAIQYFEFWNKQDFDGLRSLFAEDVSLKDWDIEVVGLEEVIKANEMIFNELPGIKAEILQLGIEKGVVFAQLAIHLNKSESISVVDVLNIEGNKINSIQAYKC